MTRMPSDDGPPDAELERLVSRFLDQSLTEEERDRLEHRLRTEPEAERYCARAIRFDATLQEAIDPGKLEWEETRRVVFDPRPGAPMWSVQRQQTVRYGGAERAGLPGPERRARWKWIVAALAAAGLATAGAVFYYQSRTSVYALRNAGFESMDLTQSPTAISRSVLYWQDFFATPGTEVCEIGRHSKGRLYAKSGRNVIRMQDNAFLNQIILDQHGKALKAVPGLRVIVTGWSQVSDPAAHTLRGSLRFVASGYPVMIQYEAAVATTPLPQGGWSPFRIELTVPENLLRGPSDLSDRRSPAPPSIDLNGKDLTLSLDNRSGTPIYLDDLAIEVHPPGR
ncbi:hypothetical protein [Luteolibacter sp. LG18]|uniref:hypothetical protein n=1 Tax=Luteolibacter sp. LG18 TaxID=2819286 RepID=UPI002B2B60F6|nr:hypothetical protein llg_26330 [Luteolibacter sp. LG18]